jgi:hypothetical protein
MSASMNPSRWLPYMGAALLAGCGAAHDDALMSGYAEADLVYVAAGSGRHAAGREREARRQRQARPGAVRAGRRCRNLGRGAAQARAERGEAQAAQPAQGPAAGWS